ncbi:MAG TPA: hypothetical protein VEP47_15525 [Reyranella sp.]|jgi:hypothetical protein|nr:hypothetical protein [Reyranella sp.]
MRLLIASMAALAAVAFAAPSFAQQEEPAAAPAPVPTAKPKAGTAAYCQTLKSASSRSSCMKKLHAQATPKAAPTTTKKAKKPTTTAPKQPDVGQLSPSPAATASTPAPTGGTVAVPPLPQKTI